MNTLQKTAGAILSLSLLCGMQVYAFLDYPSLRGQIIEQSDICQGVVKDANGESIIGASVLVKGTTNGSITGLDGDFSLRNVKKGDIIVVSYVGYQSQEIAWTGEPLNIVLKEDAEVLDEVVVIGYGAVRKADMAGSVAVLDNKNFKDQLITQVADALQGRVSGVHVENSGVPGGSVKIRIRGANSISKSNDPLYVVDGIVRESGLDGINPEDIRSMQVLKDASSTAIYGSRGSNGVVLITTKIGKAGVREIMFDASVGVSNVYKRYDILGAYDYALALKEVKGIDFSNEEMQSYQNGTAGIDWQRFGGRAWNRFTADGREEPIVDQTEDEIAGYADFRQSLGRLTVDAGVRIDHHTRTGTEWVPQAGISLRAARDGALKAMVSKGFRNPVLRELYMFGVKNPDLKPERLWNYELSWTQRLAGGSVSYGVNLFYIEGEDIIRRGRADGRNILLNQARIENWGAEADAAWHIGGGWSVNANYSWLRMEYPVPASPEHKLYAGGDFGKGRWSVSTGVQYIAGLYTAAAPDPEVREAGFVLWNLRASLRVNRLLTIFVRGENLLAERYEINAGYPMPRATVFGGLKLNL